MGALDARVAVVTGGNGGIGLATARRFVEEGAYVFITARRQSELAESALLIGDNVTSVPADITTSDGLDRIANAVRAKKGIVDIVVHSAGVHERAEIDWLTPDHFDKAFNLNARAPVFLVQKLLPLMGVGASIILVSWAMHLMEIPGHTAYAASMAALRSYAPTWAAELKDRGIRVNTLTSGSTLRARSTQSSGPGDREAAGSMYSSMAPVRCIGLADEVASAAVYLASNQSAHITGSNLIANGGVGKV